jgi:lipid-A-disaccharide synthase
MQQTKRMVVIAGEESGDAHAASFIREITCQYPNLKISGIGGQHMKNAGVELISDLARYGVTGLSEVLRHFRVIRKAYKDIKLHLQMHKPDLLVLVDYPGFNLRLAKYAKQVLGIRVLYYISPQIWAWKAGRIHTIRKSVDMMAVILPFETLIYEQAGVPVTFVGHPLVEKIKINETAEMLRSKLNLPQDQTVIALLPGSRSHEIERHMPVLRDTAVKMLKDGIHAHFVIPVAGTIHPDTIQSYFTNTTVPYTLLCGKAIEAMACSNFVIVASGTASLESALLEKPMCIIYKGSLISYIVAMMLIKVKYLGLCNLLQNKMIVPEFLQYDCNSKELARLVSEHLADINLTTAMHKRLKKLKDSLSAQHAECSISQLIAKELKFELP